jgi:hypothetical protein
MQIQSASPTNPSAASPWPPLSIAVASLLTVALMAVAGWSHSTHVFVAVFLGCFVLGSIVAANALLDSGIAQYLTRKLGHVAAGLAFLVMPLVFGGPGIPLTLCAAFTLTATLFERFTTATAHWDDNVALTLSSTIVMGLLYVRFVIA